MGEIMIHIYHGDGKGKTTAAFGLVLRQMGYGNKILIVQFLKDGDSGEMVYMKRCDNVLCLTSKMPEMFYFQLDKEEKKVVEENQKALFKKAMNIGKEYDCIILDECLDAIHLNILKESEVLSFIDYYKDKEVVITGRNPSMKLKEKADYITEMKMEKHPFQKHIAARKGVEF